MLDVSCVVEVVDELSVVEVTLEVVDSLALVGSVAVVVLDIDVLTPLVVELVPVT